MAEDKAEPSPPDEAGVTLPYSARLLPYADWTRLGTLPGYDQLTQLDPAHARIMVVEAGGDGGEIVAAWTALDVVLYEGLYIAPTYRKKPGVWRKLITVAINLARRHHLRTLLTLTVEEEIAALARKVGFVTLPAQIHRLDL